LPFTIDDLSANTVFELDVGDGRIIERATLPVSTAPGQVSDLVATPGVASVALSWSAPADGGSPITDYLIEVNVAGGDWQTIDRSPTDKTGYLHSELTPAVEHAYRVSAISAVGTGAPSATASAVPTAPLINLLKNGDFSQGTTAWSLGTGWSIADGIAERSTQSVVTHLSQSFTFEAGATYRITFEILALSGGSVRVGMNGGPFSPNRSETGLFQADLTASTAKTSLLISPNVGTAIRLRNVVMVRI
jgi:hypothetical protein